MESLSNMYRRARRKVSSFFDLLRLLFRVLWSWILWIPGIGSLCRRAQFWCDQNFAWLPWRGNESNQLENRYSSDEDEGRRTGSYSRAPHCKVPETLNNPVEVKVEDEFTGNEYRVDETDDYYCEYDSTWEHEHENEASPRRKIHQTRRNRTDKFSRFKSAAKDMQNYRHDYPNRHRTRGFEDDNDGKPNLSFYLGEIPSLPDGVYIKQFHDEWKGQYAQLEYTHSYIQWLFPLQEPGVNYEAKTLTKQEIQDFLGSTTARENLLKSYELMLDFYGIKLQNKKTGEVARADNWIDRFQNLNNHTHNNLRITRILKCLGTLGYRHYQVPLVRFFLEETLVNSELPRVKDSALSYFLFAVLDKQERRKLLKFAYDHYRDPEPFVWCPKKIQDMWSTARPPQDQLDLDGNGCTSGQYN
ncbi:opioid growth factor receptor-like [Gambusia affinis]|uniref:opioid growth factor receptor-like n=1 Tax=Gambusia affinis TaxID=33528 RepID=UPI001CDC0D62|nr:opioid growth factor receptor-like [Gambusia affinis]